MVFGCGHAKLRAWWTRNLYHSAFVLEPCRGSIEPDILQIDGRIDLRAKIQDQCLLKLIDLFFLLFFQLGSFFLARSLVFRGYTRLSDLKYFIDIRPTRPHPFFPPRLHLL